MEKKIQRHKGNNDLEMGKCPVCEKPIMRSTRIQKRDREPRILSCSRNCARVFKKMKFNFATNSNT